MTCFSVAFYTNMIFKKMWGRRKLTSNIVLLMFSSCLNISEITKINYFFLLPFQFWSIDLLFPLWKCSIFYFLTIHLKRPLQLPFFQYVLHPKFFLQFRWSVTVYLPLLILVANDIFLFHLRGCHDFQIFMFNDFSAYHIYLHAHFSKSFFLLEEITEHSTSCIHFSWPLRPPWNLSFSQCCLYKTLSYFPRNVQRIILPTQFSPTLKFSYFNLPSCLPPKPFLSAPVDFQLRNLIWILPLQGCKCLFVSNFEQFASCQLFTIDNLMSNT